MRLSTVFIIFLLILTLLSCTKTPEVKTGVWRGIIKMQDQELPFNFEILKDDTGYKAYLKNAGEKILLDEVTVSGDSINMVLHVFDASLKAKIENDELTGTFVKYYNTQGNLPFSATFDQDYRFVPTESGNAATPVMVGGKYQVEFKTEKEKYPSVGIFEQQGNRVTGTFLAPNGDYRYLEGNVVGGKLMLSTFDGNHAFLFVAQKSGDTLRGDYYSGKSSHETWVGIKNENASMPDPESLTYLKPGYENLEFSFPGLNGERIGASDPRFKGKVVILQIFGTWCPNCMDETKFLNTWYKENKDRGVEILGLAYERKDDFGYASSRVEKMKKKWNIDYDFVIAGVNDKAKASETLPALNRVLAFPTTIFIGKDGKVKYIHTGFEGPGTGIYHDRFKERFDQIVNELLGMVE